MVDFSKLQLPGSGLEDDSVDLNKQADLVEPVETSVIAPVELTLEDDIETSDVDDAPQEEVESALQVEAVSAVETDEHTLEDVFENDGSFVEPEDPDDFDEQFEELFTEDSEEILSAEDVANSLAKRNGLGDISGGADESELETFTGFDAQFDDLLEDEEVDRDGQAHTVETEGSGVKVLDAPAWSGKPIPYKEPKSKVELEDDVAIRKVNLRKKEKELLEEQEYKSDFVGKTTAIVRVNAKGETINESKGVRKRRGAPEIGGKLKPREVEFYKKLGNLKQEFSDGLLTVDLVTGPLGRAETPQEKKDRFNSLERALDARNLFRSGKSFKMDNKTVDTLSFLAMFRYATHSHIARMFGESPRTSRDRLYKLRQIGLVASKQIYSQHAIWFLTEAGVIVSGYDVKHITESRLTPSMFPHQFTVNHVAANLMGGKLNSLGLKDFPLKNRVGVDGQPRLGENLVSELEIQSSFAKIKLFEQASTFRPKIISMRDNEFKRWSETEDKENIPTPEMLYGNEWMFTLFPPLSVGTAYHVPDLVVKRPRDKNGAPRSIAVEVEINNKPPASYERTLQAYAHDQLIFSQVVWVCKTIGPAKKLERIGKELGMGDKLKIVPIWTNDGVFKGRDLWTI